MLDEVTLATWYSPSRTHPSADHQVRTPTWCRSGSPRSLTCFKFRYSEFRNIPSCRFVPLPGSDEIKSAELLNSEYSCQSTCRQKQKCMAVRLKPRAARERAFLSRRVLQSRTADVGTNCKSAFPGARIQGGRRATGLSRLSFNIPSSSQRNAGTEPVRNPYSEYSGTRNIGMYSVNGILSVSCLPSKRLIVPLNPKGLDFVHRIRRIRCRVPPSRISKFRPPDSSLGALGVGEEMR